MPDKIRKVKTWKQAAQKAGLHTKKRREARLKKKDINRENRNYEKIRKMRERRSR